MAEGQDRAKEAAARQAVERYVRPGLRLALGTGTTAAHAVRALRARFPDEPFDCVASSRGTETLARSLGLAVREPRGDDAFDLMLDGADEVAPDLALTKGGGGALFREKFLARLARQLVIMVDSTKLVAVLGSRVPIPVEVVPFARPVLARDLERAGLRPSLRTGADGRPVLTDNGNELLDLHPSSPIVEPSRLHEELKARTGIVETGLFVGLAPRVLVAEPDASVRELVGKRPPTG